ncbi:MAG: hypothetical protein H7096_05960 [Flavobacterium sp.]|nr:hypothetical protein [Pedobacter sp.]
MNRENKFPELDNKNEDQDRDKTLKDDLNSQTNIDNLAYNAEANSFEFDVNTEGGEYDHPDPYNTAVKNGGDFNSDYDEANPTAVDEYDKAEDSAENLDTLGMHIDSGKIVELSPIDEELSKTPEDDRDDLDEEGYPKNDTRKEDDLNS